MVNVRQFDVDVLLNFKSNVDNLKQLNSMTKNVGVKNSNEILSISDAVTNSLTTQNQQQMLIEQSKKREADLLLKQIDLENKQVQIKQQQLLNNRAMLPIAKKMKISTDQLSEGFKRNSLVVEKNGRIFDKQQLKYLTTMQAQKKIIKSTKQMDFGFLSLIFGGMAIQRVFGGITKSIINSYREMGDKNSEFNVGVNKLSGAFTYLKFSIGKAFADNTIVQGALNWITDKLSALGKWFDDNPNKATAVLLFAGALTTLATSMVILGNLMSFGLGLFALKLFFAGTIPATASAAILAAAGIPAWLTTALTVGKLALGAIALTFALTLLDDSIGLDDSIAYSFENIISNFLIAAGLLTTLKTGALALPVIAVAALFKINNILFTTAAETIEDAVDTTLNTISDSFKDKPIIDTDIFSNVIKDAFENGSIAFKDTSMVSDIKTNITEPIGTEVLNMLTDFNGLTTLFDSDGNVITAIKTSTFGTEFVNNLETPMHDSVVRMKEDISSLQSDINTLQTDINNFNRNKTVTVKGE